MSSPGGEGGFVVGGFGASGSTGAATSKLAKSSLRRPTSSEYRAALPPELPLPPRLSEDIAGGVPTTVPIPSCFVSSSVGLHGLRGKPPTGLSAPPCEWCEDDPIEFEWLRLPPPWRDENEFECEREREGGPVPARVWPKPLPGDASEWERSSSLTEPRSWPAQPSSDELSPASRRKLRLWRRRTTEASSLKLASFHASEDVTLAILY